MVVLVNVSVTVEVLSLAMNYLWACPTLVYLFCYLESTFLELCKRTM